MAMTRSKQRRIIGEIVGKIGAERWDVTVVYLSRGILKTDVMTFRVTRFVPDAHSMVLRLEQPNWVSIKNGQWIDKYIVGQHYYMAVALLDAFPTYSRPTGTILEEGMIDLAVFRPIKP
jgi:hypothetical protein